MKSAVKLKKTLFPRGTVLDGIISETRLVGPLYYATVGLDKDRCVTLYVHVEDVEACPGWFRLLEPNRKGEK